MSEYQYYEFQAIDHPLSEEQMRELRSYSTRARITSTSFVDDYAFGSFKGDNDAWMDRYFDAFVYLANWGTRILKLRLPSRLLDLSAANLYCGARNLLAREKDGRVIVTFLSDDEAGGEWVQGEGWLSSLIPVRAEIARGDLRALYLGWLLCVQKDRLGGKETEPPVPAGLGQLSASLESLVEFLRSDSDLLAVAAQASSPLPKIEVDYQEITAWVERLPTGEKNDLLARLVLGENSSLAAVILRRFLEQREAALGHGGKPIKRRTVRRLLDAAEEYGAERLRIEAQKEAEEKALSEREAAAARARYLDELGGREPQLWAEVERLVMTKRPASYDEAVELLKDLRDLATRKQDSGFQLRFRSLRAILMRRPALMERMRNAGLKFS